MVPDPEADGAHSRLRWDQSNQRVYQAREYDENGRPVRDIDFTVRTTHQARRGKMSPFPISIHGNLHLPALDEEAPSQSDMAGLLFDMWVGRQEITLRRVLALIGDSAVVQSYWEIRDAECAGDPEAAAELIQISDKAEFIKGARLIELADRGVQLIDGELRAQHAMSAPPWLLIVAIDSTRWLVESTDRTVYSRLQETMATTPSDGPSHISNSNNQSA